MVGIKVPGNISPPCVALCGEVSLHATLSFILSMCKSMEGGLIFRLDSRSFHTGGADTCIFAYILTKMDDSQYPFMKMLANKRVLTFYFDQL